MNIPHTPNTNTPNRYYILCRAEKNLFFSELTLKSKMDDCYDIYRMYKPV